MIKHQRSPTSSGFRSIGILIAVISALYLAREIAIPLAFALTLALILTPAVGLLQKLRVPRVPAVGIVMMLIIAAASGIGWIIFDQLVGVANELPRYQQNIHNKLEAMRAPGKGALGRATASVQALGKELSEVSAPPAAGERRGRRNAPAQPAQPLSVQVIAEPSSELESARDLVKPFLGPLGTLGIVLIFSVFLLIKENDLRNRLFRLVGLNQMNVMTEALDDATRRVSRYLLMQFAVNACFGLVCGIGLYAIGVPYAALWGSVAGLLRIVPYVGAVVSALLPFTLSLAVFDNWTPPLLVFLLFATLELTTGNFIEPWLYGANTGISSLALLLSTVFWAVLWGPAGLILSTPLTVCVVVLGRYVPQFSFLHVMLGDEAALGAEARIYQRLLAMDDQEARSIAEHFLREHPLEQLYDSVLLPALGMAEQDRHKGVLDPGREEFLFLSFKEMMVEFSEKTLAPDLGERPIATSTGRIFVIPANDQADEIAAAMLAQLLEQAGYAAIAFPRDSSLQHAIELMEPGETDTLCVSALPPFAFASAIALTHQLQQRFPRAKTMVGVWGFTGAQDRALRRFQPLPPGKLVTSLAGAVQFAAGHPRPQQRRVSPHRRRPIQEHESGSRPLRTLPQPGFGRRAKISVPKSTFGKSARDLFRFAALYREMAGLAMCARGYRAG